MIGWLYNHQSIQVWPSLGDSEDKEWTSHDEIVVYTRFDYEHRTRWWEQVEPATAVTRVLKWLDGLASKPGDVINIVLIGHGSPDGVDLRGQVLGPVELTSRCSRFLDVRINVVVKACYSGVFAKAFKVSDQRKIYVHTSANSNQRSWSNRRSISGHFKNSVFGVAYVRTLGLMKDPDENWSCWTVAKQKSFIEDQLNKAKIPLERHSSLQLLMDYVDA